MNWQATAGGISKWCALDHQSRMALANLLASFEASAPPTCSGLGAAIVPFNRRSRR